MDSVSKKLLLWLFAAVMLLVLAGVYFLYDPAQYAFFPKCPFLTMTGWLCPGCGSQRAIHHLLHLRLPEAFSANVLVPLALPYMAGGLWARTESSRLQHSRLRSFFYGKTAILTVFFVILFFWIGRNVWAFC